MQRLLPRVPRRAQGVMPSAGDNEEFLPKLFPRSAAGLDGVAVGAQRDHLDRVVRAAAGQVVDMVDLEDRVTGVGAVVRLTSAVGFSQLPPLRSSTARRADADRTGLASTCVTRLPSFIILLRSAMPQRRR